MFDDYLTDDTQGSQNPYPPGTTPQPPASSGGGGGTDWGSVEQQLRQSAVSRGVTYDASDLEGIKRNTSYTNAAGQSTGMTLDQALKNQQAIYGTRAQSTDYRTVDSQSAAGNALYGSGSGNGTNRPGGSFNGAPGIGNLTQPNTTPQFSDTSSRLLEDYALNRFQQLQNPDPNSGTALYENYLRQLSETLKAAPYSDAEAAQMKTSVFDGLVKERDSTRQRWMEELSRRGINPSSGVALDGIRKIDEHFETLRTESERQFAVNGIGLRQANQLQAAGTLGALAGNEEGRLSSALTYGSLPYELENNAFQRNLQLVGAGGSPTSVLNSALQMAQQIQNNNQISSANRQQLTSGLLQYLGFLFG